MQGSKNLLSTSVKNRSVTKLELKEVLHPIQRIIQTCVLQKQCTETGTRRLSVKKVFLNILQN